MSVVSGWPLLPPARRRSEGASAAWAVLRERASLPGGARCALRGDEVDVLWEVLLGDAPVVAATVGAAGRGTRVNDAALMLLGAPAAEVLGAPWQVYTAVEDHDRANDTVERLRLGDSDQYVAGRRWVRADGRIVSVEVQITAVRDPDGALAGVLVLATDTTGRDDAIQQAVARFREAFDAAPIAMAVLDLERRFREVNPEMARIAGCNREQLIGVSVDEFVDPQDLPASYADVAALLDSDQGYRALRRGHNADGEPVRLLVSSVLLRDHTRTPYALFLQAVDVTDSVRAEERLRVQLAQFTALSELGRLALADVPVLLLDGYAVRAVSEHAGAAGSALFEVRGELLHPVAWHGPSSAHPADRKVTSRDEVGFGFRHDEGTTFDTSTMRGGPEARAAGWRSGVTAPVRRDGIRDGVLVAYWPNPCDVPDTACQFVASIANVLAGARARRAAETELRHAATHDPLTGLANRRLLEQELAYAAARARRREHPTAVLAVDLDRFKDVNDRFGHAAGDTVIREVAGRLQRAVRETDTVARVGGDEFVVIAEDLPPGELDRVLSRIERAVQHPVSVDGDRVRVGVSIGVVQTSGEHTAAQLLAAADRHLYQRKRVGRGGASVTSG